ncbi:MAG: hypothetical protein ABIQ18_36145 [Umezawaea sp.]
MGAVRLDGARIGGNIRCDGARFHSASDPAFLGIDMQVDDGLFLDHGFRATTDSTTAAVRIRGSRFGGQLVLRGAEVTGAIALDLKHVRTGMDPVRARFRPRPGRPRRPHLRRRPSATLVEWLDLLANRTRRYAWAGRRRRSRSRGPPGSPHRRGARRSSAAPIRAAPRRRERCGRSSRP